MIMENFNNYSHEIRINIFFLNMGCLGFTTQSYPIESLKVRKIYFLSINIVYSSVLL